MPKSKRARVVHLSKVEKKGKELNQKIFAAVREAADAHQYCFVFEVENMRNTYLKDVRTQFTDSRIFFGKTKVMAVALGSSPETSHLPSLYKLSAHLHGSVGLLFTSQPPPQILSFFSSYSETSFARAGVHATSTFTVPAGVVYSTGGQQSEEEDVPVAHSVEPTLRKWGMPTRLVKGKIMLEDDYQVCREGQALDSNQTALLKMFGVAMAEFRIKVTAYYEAATEKVTVVDGETGEAQEEEQDGEDDE